jgi:hypothetical protein
MAQIGSTRGAVPPAEGEPEGKLSLGRRTLLTRGGIVAAGVVGAGAVATAVAGPASAQATTAVDMNTANDAGTSATPTELDADNNTTPAFILTNTGIDDEIPEGYTATYAFSGPNLRLTRSPGSPDPTTIPNAFEPTPSTVGGDLTATADGQLWFTHDFAFASTPTTVAAPVHTEATANVYAPLSTPARVLDTRTASSRTNIVNPSGNLNSAGQLKAGKTIYINLDNQVYFADAVFANVTVTDTEGNGFLTIWSGAGTVPITSSINFAKAQTLSDFLVSGIAAYSTTVLNVVAIYAHQTTHVILDVAGFMMPGFEYAKFTVGTVNEARNARLQRAQQAMRNARRA